LTCTGFWLILPSRINKASGAELIISKVLGLICLVGATATRSLGIFNALPVIWQGFVHPIYQGDRRVSVCSLSTLCIAAHFSHQLVFKRGIMTGMAGMVIALPVLAFQYVAYVSYCSEKQTRPWCGNTIPSVYSFVQDHYW
jgi:hypothetical protein